MRNILWDFDGVILDSMNVRDFGFKEIFKEFPKETVDELIHYHRENGGLSRYVKIRYFFEKILEKKISNKEIQNYASEFSIIMKKLLIDKNNLIQDSLEFIKKNHQKYNFHIVSGSDQVELRFLCETLELSQYFLSIHGSPTPKGELVRNVLNECSYIKEETCLIGDSINDKDAAEANKILFIGYNNEELNQNKYITSFVNNSIFN